MYSKTLVDIITLTWKGCLKSYRPFHDPSGSLTWFLFFGAGSFRAGLISCLALVYPYEKGVREVIGNSMPLVVNWWCVSSKIKKKHAWISTNLFWAFVNQLKGCLRSCSWFLSPISYARWCREACKGLGWYCTCGEQWRSHRLIPIAGSSYSLNHLWGWGNRAVPPLS